MIESVGTKIFEREHDGPRRNGTLWQGESCHVGIFPRCEYRIHTLPEGFDLRLMGRSWVQLSRSVLCRKKTAWRGAERAQKTEEDAELHRAILAHPLPCKNLLNQLEAGCFVFPHLRKLPPGNRHMGAPLRQRDQASACGPHPGANEMQGRESGNGCAAAGALGERPAASRSSSQNVS